MQAVLADGGEGASTQTEVADGHALGSVAPDLSGAEAAPTAPPAVDPPGGRRGVLRRRSLLVGGAALAVLAVGGVTFVAVKPFEGTGDEETVANQPGTALAPVERRTLTPRTQVNGTLGYAGHHDVVSRVEGTLTALPAIGQVVNQGEVLFGLDAAPVLLLYGALPAYRDMPAGSSTADLTGPDIQQLNAAPGGVGVRHDRGTGPQLEHLQLAHQASGEEAAGGVRGQEDRAP